MEEDVSRRSIVLYDKAAVDDIETLASDVREECQCEVEDLPHIEAFILHYPDGNQVWSLTQFHHVSILTLKNRCKKVLIKGLRQIYWRNERERHIKKKPKKSVIFELI